MYSLFEFKSFTLAAASSKTMHGRADFLTIAPTPIDEECTQAGERLIDQQRECIALIHQLIRTHGEPPETCEFFLMENYHDFGIYYEAAIFYQPDEEISTDYALTVENDMPEKWDAAALKELRENGHSKYQPAKVIQLNKAS